MEFKLEDIIDTFRDKKIVDLNTSSYGNLYKYKEHIAYERIARYGDNSVLLDLHKMERLYVKSFWNKP